MSGAVVPGRRDPARPSVGRPPGAQPRGAGGPHGPGRGRGQVRLGLTAAVGILLAVLVGCSDPGSSVSGDAASRPKAAATPNPPPPNPDGTATPGPTPPASDPLDSATRMPGSAPSAVATPSAGAGAAAGGSGTAVTSGPSGAPGASDSPAAPGNPVATDSAAPAAPTPQASPVFVGEACSPDLDTGPAMAVNGLVLYCAPEEGAAAAGGLGRWSSEPPAATAQARPMEGGTCGPSDIGRVVQGSAGRPVSCLRDPTGALTWSDVS